MNDLNDMFVSDLMCRWLSTIKVNMRQISYVAYYRTNQKYIEPMLGHYKLAQLNRKILLQFVSALREKGLTEKSVQDINGKLNAALRWGVEQGYMDHAGFCVKIRCSAGKEIRVLSNDEEEVLQKALLLDRNNVSLGLYLSLKTGISAGELCALKWNDIHLEKGKISINKQLQRITNLDSSDGAKTKIYIVPKKNREIPINGELLKILEAAKENQTGFILTGNEEKSFEPRNLNMKLKKMLKDLNLDPLINFQTFHATYIQRNLKEGLNPAQVSQLVGAKNQGYLWKRYSAANYDRQ